MNPSCLAPPIAYPREFTGDSSQFHQRETPFNQIYRETRDGNTSAAFYHTGLGSIGDFRKLYNVRSSNDVAFSASNIVVSGFDSIGAHQVTSPGIISAPVSGQYAALHHHYQYSQNHHHGVDLAGNGPGGSVTGPGGSNIGGAGGSTAVPYGTIKYGVLERDAQTPSSALAASRACTALYCLSAHRVHAGLLPNLDNIGNNSSSSSKNQMHNIHKEVSS